MKHPKLSSHQGKGFHRYSEVHSFNAKLPKGGKGIAPLKGKKIIADFGWAEVDRPYKGAKYLVDWNGTDTVPRVEKSDRPGKIEVTSDIRRGVDLPEKVDIVKSRHVYEVDDRHLIREAAHNLKPGGELVIEKTYNKENFNKDNWLKRERHLAAQYGMQPIKWRAAMKCKYNPEDVPTRIVLRKVGGKERAIEEERTKMKRLSRAEIMGLDR
jgi:SAM-dependent methyltransferase